MTEAPVGVSSGQKARGCPGPTSPKLNGSAGPKPTCTESLGAKQTGLGSPCHTSSGPVSTCPRSTGPVSTGPGSTCPGPPGPGGPEEDNYVVCKRKCGCSRTSDKLKEILQTFPNPQPPDAIQTYMARKFDKTDKASGYSYGQSERRSCKVCRRKPKESLRSASIGVGDKGCCPSGSSIVPMKDNMDPCLRCMLHRRMVRQAGEGDDLKTCGGSSKSWQIVTELVSLVQLSVTATALALYYLIYCYMQLVYYTLRSALYFHNADGPMKITIGVVTLTSLIVGFNILMRMEGIIGIVY